MRNLLMLAFCLPAFIANAGTATLSATTAGCPGTGVGHWSPFSVLPATILDNTPTNNSFTIVTGDGDTATGTYTVSSYWANICTKEIFPNGITFTFTGTGTNGAYAVTNTFALPETGVKMAVSVIAIPPLCAPNCAASINQVLLEWGPPIDGPLNHPPTQWDLIMEWINDGGTFVPKDNPINPFPRKKTFIPNDFIGIYHWAMPRSVISTYTNHVISGGSWGYVGDVIADAITGEGYITNDFNVNPIFYKSVFKTNAVGSTNLYPWVTNFSGAFNKEFPSGDTAFALPMFIPTGVPYGSVSNLFDGVPSGTTFNIWQNGGYVQSGYTSKGGWTDNFQLQAGVGVICHFPSSYTNTFTGHVHTGALTNVLTPGGWTLVGSKVPKAGWLEDLGVSPGLFDVASKMINGTWVNYTYILPGFFQPLEWTGYDGVNCDQYLGPWMGVGESVFYKNVSSNATWIQNFNP